MHMSVQTHYQAELDAGRFCLQQCPQCQRHVFTPRELCPHCGASPLRWVRASGLGTVYSTSTISRKQDAGGNYNVALIDLDEGVRMMSRVEGLAPEAVHIGLRVQAQVVQKEGRGLVLFQPAQEQGAAA
ncbi:OB-fold domain-containing protein [Acidovorax sp. Be4]|uniref:OB-fold domain-containing protein n=1 Tax=Acidovorax bellezanensis TaxID=2976702 RepID=A0ABT2PLR2_9BURK|nr:OB-fold domain-containing protein [Acidovorax sp. Be4]MCT9810038.1 OB-fold domain-containing protein [Acidovorax sp. Be4]